MLFYGGAEYGSHTQTINVRSDDKDKSRQVKCRNSFFYVANDGKMTCRFGLTGTCDGALYTESPKPEDLHIPSLIISGWYLLAVVFLLLLLLMLFSHAPNALLAEAPLHSATFVSLV